MDDRIISLFKTRSFYCENKTGSRLTNAFSFSCFKLWAMFCISYQDTHFFLVAPNCGLQGSKEKRESSWANMDFA